MMHTPTTPWPREDLHRATMPDSRVGSLRLEVSTILEGFHNPTISIHIRGIQSSHKASRTFRHQARLEMQFWASSLSATLRSVSCQQHMYNRVKGSCTLTYQTSLISVLARVTGWLCYCVAQDNKTFWTPNIPCFYLRHYALLYGDYSLLQTKTLASVFPLQIRHKYYLGNVSHSTGTRFINLRTTQ